ncbi:hypothetical protein NIES267_22230 [Calothrix parasitica NIES-267]|uniref:Transposase n=1 Tax=Calothrix parasitica NIES-267 TaxID=1973488 RepID=A0A1Z4LNE5_9CYAN|nr:hypothetical protein NIES267_22230 [Calothrix parasitica NIES-267]
MTQKSEAENLVSTVLQTIDTREIADESMRRTVEILLNLIEQQQVEIKELREENQKLRDENNRLKGEEGKPDIKANKKKGFKNDHSSEKERKTPTEHHKRSKNETIKIDREEIVTYPKEKLPANAEFKGYEEVVIQDILLTTDNVLFRKQKYYSSQTGKTSASILARGLRRRIRSGDKSLSNELVLWWKHNPR